MRTDETTPPPLEIALETIAALRKGLVPPPTATMSLDLSNLGLNDHDLEIVLAKLKQTLLGRPLLFLDLSDNQFTRIPPKAFDKISCQELTLDRNPIEEIEPNAFYGLTVDNLCIKDNFIQSIRSGAFSGSNINSLQIYTTSENIPTKIEPGAFRGFKSDKFGTRLSLNLTDETLATVISDLRQEQAEKPDFFIEYLGFGNNKCTKIPTKMFDELRIGKLDIDHCHISEIEPQAFSGFTANSVSIDNHPLQVVRSGAFVGSNIKAFSIVNSLSPHNPPCTTIEPGAFEGFENKESTIELAYLGLSDESLMALTADLRATKRSNPNFSLRKLNLSHNQFTTIPTKMFDGLHVNSLIMNNCHIAEIEPQAFSGLTANALLMDNNPLLVVKSGAFTNSDIQEVDLSDRTLAIRPPTTIEPAAFDGLRNKKSTMKLSRRGLSDESLVALTADLRATKQEDPDFRLEALELGRNQFTKIPARMFDGLSIGWLSLDKNEISEIESEAFKNLKANNLCMISNPVQVIKSHAFTDSDIQQIDINNRASTSHSPTTIEPCAFEGFENKESTIKLSHLGLSDESVTAMLSDFQQNRSAEPSFNVRNLNLNHNRITRIPPMAFDELGIQSLDLSNNNITGLDPYAFGGTGHPERTLHLSCNQLVTIPSGAFGNCQAKNIDLSYNQIAIVEDGAFAGSSVRCVDLAGNQLSSISPSAFNGANRLSLLSMQDNQFTPEARQAILNSPAFQRLGAEITSTLERLPAYYVGLDETPSETIKLLTKEVQDLINPILMHKFAEMRDSNGQLAQFSLAGFLRGVDKTTYFQNEQTRDSVVLPGLNHFLSPEHPIDIKDRAAQAVMCLGNCATPVCQFLIQTYIDLKKRTGQKVEDWVLEKCAVRDAISIQLKEELSSASDRAEYIETLLDQLFATEQEFSERERSPLISGRKNLSISSSQYFIPPRTETPLFRAFVKLVCITNEAEEPVKDENGLFMRDDEKVLRIKSDFLRKNGIVNPIVEKAVLAFQGIINMEPFSDLLADYENKETMSLIDPNVFRHTLEDRISSKPEENHQDVCNACLLEMLPKLRNELIKGGYISPDQTIPETNFAPTTTSPTHESILDMSRRARRSVSLSNLHIDDAPTHAARERSRSLSPLRSNERGNPRWSL